jgi:hypothetical protein
VKTGITPTKYERTEVRSEVKSYANDPYFVKKAKEAKEFLRKAGLPKSRNK